jgi:aryl-alcohol dehydrogenase-like predicted oxidoreductase
VRAGYVRAIGLSEVGPDKIRRAQVAHPISDLQIEYSLISRGPETTSFPVLMAAEKGISASRLAIAWVLAKGTTIVPLIGARTRTQLAESLGALQVTFNPAEMSRIEDAIPASAVAATRYDEQQMRILDSERSAK